MLLFNLSQDHNHDFIVMLPDWDPSNLQKVDLLPLGNRRFLSQATNSDMPQAHLWYPTEEVTKALKLFLGAGKDYDGSLTFR